MRRVLYPDSADPCNATCAGCSCTIELADIELIQSCEDAGEDEFYTQVSGTYALTFSGTASECCPEGEELNILLVLDYILEDGTTGSSEQVIYGPLVTDGTPTALPLYPDVEWTLTGTCQPIVSFTLTAYVGCGTVDPGSSFCSTSWGYCQCSMSVSSVTVEFSVDSIEIAGTLLIEYPHGETPDSCCGENDARVQYDLHVTGEYGTQIFSYTEILAATTGVPYDFDVSVTGGGAFPSYVTSWYLEVWILCDGVESGFGDQAQPVCYQLIVNEL